MEIGITVGDEIVRVAQYEAYNLKRDQLINLLTRRPIWIELKKGALIETSLLHLACSLREERKNTMWEAPKSSFERHVEEIIHLLLQYGELVQQFFEKFASTVDLRFSHIGGTMPKCD